MLLVATNAAPIPLPLFSPPFLIFWLAQFRSGPPKLLRLVTRPLISALLSVSKPSRFDDADLQAYLIQREGLAFGQAWDLVKSARPSACPNPGFKAQLVAASPSVEVHGVCPPEYAAVRAALAAHVASGAVCGAAVSLVRDNTVVIDLWAGHTSLQRATPWRPDTIANVWSVTKAWAALCCHVLRERGHLEYDTPIAAYWPEYGCHGKEGTTIRHVLTHAAGIPLLRTPVHDTAALTDWDRMVGRIAAETAWYPPGSRTCYHAFTYGHIVGEVVRRCDPLHRTVGVFFRDEVLAPLGLEDECFLGGAPPARSADLYWGRDNVDAAQTNPDQKSFEDELSKLLERYAAWEAGGDVAEGGKGGGSGGGDGTPGVSGATGGVGRAEAMEAMRKHRSMNPRRTPEVVNSDAWRAAEMPASGGHCTARGLARLFGHLASAEAPHVLAPATLAEATAKWATVSGEAWGGGLSLEPLGPELTLQGYGHAGLGGSLGFADPERRLGFGFTLNKLRQSGTDGIAVELAKVCYTCLSKAEVS